MLLLLTALTTAYGLLFLSATVVVVAPALPLCDAATAVALLGKPGLVVSAGAVLAVMAATPAKGDRARCWMAALFTILLAGMTAAAWQIVHPANRASVLDAFAIMVGTELVARSAAALRQRSWRALWRPAATRWAVAWRFCVATAVLAVVLLSPNLFLALTKNEHGLVSHMPSRSYVRDFTNETGKDGYPKASYDINSLGYRDREPSPPGPGVRRVLVVGDSYVLGDGIPTNEQTISACLQRALDKASPAGWQVMNAGVEGNGLYGYARAVSALVPALKPQIVVVGYLGWSDEVVFDAQRLVDVTPANRQLNRLVANLRVRQFVHEATVKLPWRERIPKSTDAYFKSLMDSMARVCSEHGAKLVILQYLSRVPADRVPDGAVHVTLPDELAYPGRRNDFWYELDYHPKPALNEKLAAIIAPRLIGAAGEGRHGQ